MSALLNHIKEEAKYPKEAKKKKLEEIGFEINIDSKATEVESLKG